MTRVRRRTPLLLLACAAILLVQPAHPGEAPEKDAERDAHQVGVAPTSAPKQDLGKPRPMGVPEDSEQRWMNLFAQEKAADVASALREFAALGEELDGMPYALQAASDLLISKDHEVRKAAEAAMNTIGPRGIDALAATLRGNRRFMSEYFKNFNPLVGSRGVGGRLGKGGNRPPDERTTVELAAALRSDVKEERMKALDALALNGAKSKEAVPALIKHLESRGTTPESDDERRKVVAVFRSIGPDAKEAVPALIRALEPFRQAVPPFEERSNARGLVTGTMEALGAIGPASAEACRALIDIAAQDDFLSAAREALKGIGEPAAAALAKAVEGPVTKRSLCAARMRFDVVDNDTLAEPHFILGLSSKDRPVSERAVTFLLQIRPDSPDAIRWLIDDLLTESPNPFGGTMHGAFAQSKLRHIGDAAIPYLGDSVKTHAKDEIRAACVHVLARMEPKNQKIAAALFGGLGQDIEKVRDETFRALYEYRAFLAPAREKLAAVLEDKQPANVESAANALYLLAVSAPDFASFNPLLLKCLTDERNAIRTVAAFAAGSFGPDAAPLKNELTKLLDDSCSPAREHAALALAQLDPAARLPEKYAHLLVDFIASEFTESRALDAVAREALKLHGAQAVPMLIDRIQIKYETLSMEEVAERIKKKNESKPPIIETRIGKCIVLCGVEFIEYEVQRNGKPVK
ncbi:MAG: hypothetical protein L6R28_10455 [Planctomycetes bacterium]|nr:hypothetical protein [Planctomycetota bacterium]